MATFLRAFFILISFSSVVAEERPLSGEEIKEILAGSTVRGAGFSQIFFAPKSGWPAGTTYDQSGNLTFGKWKTEGNRYCSIWPPSQLWSCYAMYSFTKANTIWVVWVDDDGRRFEGAIVKDN